MIRFTLLLFISFGIIQLSAQEFSEATFNDTRVINSHSVEMLDKGIMDFRVYHRFGDFAGTNGGWPNFYGLDNAADIGIGFDYGIGDNFNVGISRTKGAGLLGQLVNTYAKVRLMRQQDNGRNPVSITVLGTANISTMAKSESTGVLNNFPRFSNRLAYHSQLMVARRVNQRLSIQASINYTYRDIVFDFDQNDILSVGINSRIRLSKATAFIFDGTFPFLVQDRDTPETYFVPLSFGIEFGTGGGHVFQLNVTNARGISETDYIPYSFSNWADGQFRLGFTIARQFTVL